MPKYNNSLSMSSAASRGSRSNNKRAREHQSDPQVKIYIQDAKEGEKLKLLYRISSGAPLKLMLDYYCEELNLDYKTVVFTHKGKRIQRTKSAAQLGIEEYDVIEAFVEVRGG